MLKQLLFSVCIFIFFSTSLFAQNTSEKVDNYVQQAMLDRHIPGLSLAVIMDGVPIKVKSYGMADIEHSTPVNPETVFQSGSVGKQFTAAAIMQLKQQGKLKLDDKIASYFKDSPASWQDITIRHLLTHTSGIPDYESANLLDLKKDYTEQELLQLAMTMPLDFQPGEKWSYSNTAYVVLGILIHQITGKFYGDVLQENIFTPLSMETARIINEPDIIMNRASGYELQNGEWKNQSWVSPTLNTTADGSLYVSILDFIKWDAAITKEKILNHEDLQAMVSPVKLNNNTTYPYGFAWFLNPVNGHRSFQHSGSWQGFNSYIARFPDDKLTVIVLTNLNPSNPGLVASDVAALYTPELSRPKVTVLPDNNPPATNLITQLFKNPSTFDFNNNLIEKDALPQIKALTLANISLLKTFGEVQRVTAIEAGSVNNQTKYLVKYKVGARVATVTINSQGQITNIVSQFE